MPGRAILITALAAGLTTGAAGRAACQDGPGAAIDGLIDTARTLPAEFRSDVLIRLADSGMIASPSAEGDALAEAFMFASGAEEPFHLDWWGPLGGIRISSRQATRASAFANQLDQLTLETRALRLLADIDVERAWSLEPFVTLQLPPLHCQDMFGHNVENAYRNLAAFAGTLPDEYRFLVLERYVGAMSSSLQIAPTAALLANVPMSRDERSLLIRDFAFELAHIADTDRAFTIAVARDRLPEHIRELGALVLWQDEDPAALLEAFRSFLAAHFSGRRCAGDLEGPDLRMTQWFNDDLRKLTSADIPPIDYDAFAGHPIERWSRPDDPANTPGYDELAREITEALGSASAGPAARRGAIAPTPFLKTPEVAVSDVLVWQGIGSRSPADFMIEKASLLQVLVSRLPAGDWLREAVMDELVTFLAGAGQLTDDRLDWFLHVTTLLDATRRGGGAVERERLLDRFEGSGNLVMMAYASLERLTGTGR
jgi:hypothetical protein